MREFHCTQEVTRKQRKTTTFFRIDSTPSILLLFLGLEYLIGRTICYDFQFFGIFVNCELLVRGLWGHGCYSKWSLEIFTTPF